MEPSEKILVTINNGETIETILEKVFIEPRNGKMCKVTQTIKRIRPVMTATVAVATSDVPETAAPSSELASMFSASAGKPK